MNLENNKIALFTTINSNYIPFAKRCFELFENENPGVFDFYIITSESKNISLPNINVITLNPKDYINGNPNWGWPPESFLYYVAPNIFNEKGYKYSMYVDADCVSLGKLDFTWLNDSFVLAGSPRMRNDLSEEIDAWYYLNAIGKSVDNINFLENTFNLQNKSNIIDINFYRHLSLSWNWYYEQPEYESQGGEDANILHMAWSKPWKVNTQNINKNLKKGFNVWNNNLKELL
mgnify:CR=1 FL=1